jgi:glycerophosphoryl diester phosphodiesterase
VTLKIGHRGASGYEPENTLKSFARAIELGADGIELDIQRCASGELVVFHDDKLERLTGAPGLIEETSLTDLRRLRVKGSEPILTLEETLAFINRRITVHIEVKSDAAGEIIGPFMESMVQKGLAYEDFYVISFFHPLLKRIRETHPKIKTGAIIAALPVMLAAFGTDCGATSVNPAVGFLSKDLVADAHRRNLEVYTWTCNHERDIAKARSLGVTGMMGDFPDRL